MSLPIPTILPEWASEDVIDPVSGQNNVVTPPTEIQEIGWTRAQFPPRQWFNWLGRYTYLWLQYFAQQASLQTVSQATAGNSYTVQAFSNTSLAAGGIASILIIDTGTTVNFFQGLAYIPAGPLGVTSIQQVSANNLTVSTISSTGVITVSGGTGPYLIQTTLNNVPA